VSATSWPIVRSAGGITGRWALLDTQRTLPTGNVTRHGTRIERERALEGGPPAQEEGARSEEGCPRRYLPQVLALGEHSGLEDELAVLRVDAHDVSLCKPLLE
jgi:hypothetical protein